MLGSRPLCGGDAGVDGVPSIHYRSIQSCPQPDGRSPPWPVPLKLQVARYGGGMGVAVSMLARTEPAAEDYCARLAAAGYVLDDAFDLWMHPELGRALDARIAARLTADQIDEWIAAGR